MLLSWSVDTLSGPGPGPWPATGWGRRWIAPYGTGVALDLLDDLVDVAVEDGHGSETTQIGHGLGGIGRAPAPFRIDRPQRHVRENDDRLTRRTPA